MIKANSEGSLDVGFPIKSITAMVQTSNTSQQNTDAAVDQKKPTSVNVGMIIFAVLLPIFLIFVGFILITKYVLKKKSNKAMTAIHPDKEHQETNNIIEVDYLKMGVKPIKATVISKNIGRFDSLVEQNIDNEEMEPQPMPSNLFDRPTSRMS